MVVLMRRWCGAALMLLAFAAPAVAQPASEAAVKAAYLFRFAGYVEWPAAQFSADDAPLVIAVIGADEVAAELEILLPGRTVGARRAVVRRSKGGDVTDAHMLFVGRGVPDARAVLRRAQQQGALTVTEIERGLESGSAVNFVVHDDRVGFEVSLDGAQRSGLQISSRMLAVARRVIPRGGAEASPATMLARFPSRRGVG